VTQPDINTLDKLPCCHYVNRPNMYLLMQSKIGHQWVMTSVRYCCLGPSALIFAPPTYVRSSVIVTHITTGFDVIMGIQDNFGKAKQDGLAYPVCTMYILSSMLDFEIDCSLLLSALPVELLNKY
jgi:hypothetical protein